MAKIYVYPQSEFDRRIRMMGLDDTNVENAKGKLFISIIGTRECLEHYLHEPNTRHYFEADHKNVLNLDFDDLDEDIEWEGHTFKALSDEQAMKAVDFLDDNFEDGPKDVYVHCKAGISRSQALAAFVHDAYGALYGLQNDVTVDRANLNHGTLRTLKNAFYEKHQAIV